MLQKDHSRDRAGLEIIEAPSPLCLNQGCDFGDETE